MNPEASYPYSPSFQKRILASLLQDPTLYTRYNNVWNPSYFTDSTYQVIANCLFDFRELNKHSPNKDTLLNYVVTKYENSDFQFKKRIVDEINDLYSFEVVDKEWTEKVIVDWAKAQAIESAILTGAKYLEEGKKDKILSLIEDAYKVGEDITKLGTIVSNDFKSPSALILSQKKSKIPTGFSDLDPLIGGGVGGGELFVFLGPPKGFKSGNMLNATIPALQAPYGKKVTYISLELREEKVLERYCYRLTKMNKDQLQENPEEFDRKFEERASKVLTGQLAIKNYPTRTATPSMIRRYLDMLDSQGHTTELLVIDYGNIMKPEHKYNSDFTGIGENFESLRAIAIERDIPVITAARTNREGLLTDNLRMEHIAGSMEIAACADYVVALLQTDSEHRDWTMRHKLLLNRNEDCGIIIGNSIDYSTYTIYNTGIVNTEDEESEKKSSKKKKDEPEETPKKIYNVSLDTVKKLEKILKK